jgi:O-antigen ligase
MSIVNAAAKAMGEGFVGTMSSEKRRDAYVDFLAVVIAFALSLVLLVFIGKYLWNNVVVDLLTIAKPVKSFWQIIGFMIFVSLIHS